MIVVMVSNSGEKMSLVTLTFGSQKSGFSVEAPILVSTPQDRIKIDPSQENKVLIRKSCQFLGHSDVYLVAEIVSGVIASNMHAIVNGQEVQIVELESKIGNKIAKKGMTVGLTVRGVPDKDAFPKNAFLNFSL